MQNELLARAGFIVPLEVVGTEAGESVHQPFDLDLGLGVGCRHFDLLQTV